MRIFRRALAAVLLLLVLAPAASAAERILSFDSSIRVGSDGTLTVREDITVLVEHIQIQRGLLRDFPTDYTSPGGGRVRVGFTVQTVLLDGGSVPWKTERISNGVRVRIGDPGSYAPLGEHTYTIVYTTTEQVGFFEDHDELYWNVTGTGWDLSIDRATALVTLPEDVPVEKIAWYTGPQGSRAQDATGRTAGHTAWFQTTVPLGVREGLTIVAGFPKGFIHPSKDYLKKQARAAFAERWGKYLPPLAVVLVLIYYILVWSRWGKDLRPGTIIPLFYPPEGVTPAMASYVYNQKLRDDTFTATLIDLGVRGYLRIEEHDVPKGLFSRGKNRFTLHPTDKDRNGLPLVENAFLASLFPGGRSVDVDKENHEILSSAKGAITDHVAYRGKDYFLRNWKWVGLGVLITLVLMGYSTAYLGAWGAGEGASLFSSVWLGTWTLGIGVMVFSALAALGEGFRRKKAGFFIRGLFLLFFSIPFMGVEALFFRLFSGGLSYNYTLSLAAAFFLNVLFFKLMKNYTPEGRKLMDRLEGLRMYMSAAEKGRIKALARVDMPEDTPRHFESLLPYAIALGVEKEWAAHFDEILKKAQYDPQWYTGAYPVYTLGAGSFMTGLSGGLGSAVASSSVAPGSGSGFSGGGGGGGFSGGGGGGGGGGGW